MQDALMAVLIKHRTLVREYLRVYAEVHGHL